MGLLLVLNAHVVIVHVLLWMLVRCGLDVELRRRIEVLLLRRVVRRLLTTSLALLQDHRLSPLRRRLEVRKLLRLLLLLLRQGRQLPLEGDWRKWCVGWWWRKGQRSRSALQTFQAPCFPTFDRFRILGQERDFA